MCKHAADADIDGRDVVDAGRHPWPDHELDDDTGRRRVRAQVGERGDAQRKNASARVQRELRLAGDVAPVRGGEELLDALGRPLHRPHELPRAIRRDDVFRIKTRLHAEAAADVADEHAHLVGGDAEHLCRERVTQPRRHL